MTTATPTLPGHPATPAGPTAPQAALALIRDQSVSVEDLARYFGQSETWAAGLVDAVCEDCDVSAGFDDTEIPPAERDE